MNNLTDLTKILKYAPQNLVLYSPEFGTVSFQKICYNPDTEKPIGIEISNDEKQIILDNYGRMNKNGKCVLFPRQEYNAWHNWQTYIMPECVGSVISDCNGYEYLIGSYYLYPKNPNDPFSVIRMHKFDFTNSKFVNKKDKNKFFKELNKNGWEYQTGKINCKMIIGNWYILNHEMEHISDANGEYYDLPYGYNLKLKCKDQHVYKNYICVDAHGKEFTIDKDYLLPFSIYDTKPGDILNVKMPLGSGKNKFDKTAHYVFIFKDICQGEIRYYAAFEIINKDKVRFDNPDESNDRLCYTDCVFYPASKNEIQDFFKNLVNSGYLWDSELKKLFRFKLAKNIENKHKKNVSEQKQVLEPFDKILVRQKSYKNSPTYWKCCFYSHHIDECVYFIGDQHETKIDDIYIVSYNEKTKYLVGTSEDYNGKYLISI